MFASRAALISSRAMATRRYLSSSKPPPGVLEADAGALATRVHHSMTLGLAVMSPIFFLIPESWTDGWFNKTFGLLLSANIAGHSWIGMNYVCTDYVPKVSKALLGPSRIFNIGLAAVTFLGLARINFSSKGGITGCIKGLWNPPSKGKKQ